MKRQTLLQHRSVGFCGVYRSSLVPGAFLGAEGNCPQLLELLPRVAQEQHSFRAWCKEVEKRTNGRVKITYFPNGTLTPAAQTYDNVVKGIADIGESVFGYTRGKFPMMAMIDLPLGYSSGVQSTGLINAYYNKFKPKELDEVKVLFVHAHGAGIVHTKKPVYKLEDLKGMKIRAEGTVVPIVEALGASPVGTTHA